MMQSHPDAAETALALVTRGPGTWPPSATGRGWGPQDASYRAAMTQQSVGGYGVSVSERSSPVPCVSRSAEWSEAARQPDETRRHKKRAALKVALNMKSG